MGSHNRPPMPAASVPPKLQPFIEDELARVPLLVEGVLQALADTPLKFDPAATAAHRQTAGDQRAFLQRSRPAMVAAYCDTLREQVLQHAREARETSGSAKSPKGPLQLSLVDDDAVEVDVELQRAIAAIQNTAEYELRELNSFTAALLGERSVTRNTNPFRAEAHARALLAACRALPAGVATQLALMNRAVQPLADALRKAYAAACGRLEDQGIEPAAFRTIILPPGHPGSRGGSGSMSTAAPPSLQALRDSLPMPLGEVPAPVRGSTGAFATGAVGHSPPSPVDQRVIDLLTRLFDAITSDPRLPDEVRRMAGRLQSPTIRVALRDPGMLHTYDHPVWVLLDRIAFTSERLHGGSEPEARARFLRYAEGLLDNLVAESAQDESLYRWACERLRLHDEYLLVQRCKAAQPQIEALRERAVRLQAGVDETVDSGLGKALDVSQLDTVPAALLDPPPDRLDGLAPRRPALPRVGQWWSVFLQGGWRELQLLWSDEAEALFLFRESGGDTWALQRRALDRLSHTGLMEPLLPPSLVRQAAVQVLRQLGSTATR